MNKLEGPAEAGPDSV